jgi:hypothetical protein
VSTAHPVVVTGEEIGAVCQAFSGAHDGRAAAEQ